LYVEINCVTLCKILPDGEEDIYCNYYETICIGKLQYANWWRIESTVATITISFPMIGTKETIVER